MARGVPRKKDACLPPAARRPKRTSLAITAMQTAMLAGRTPRNVINRRPDPAPIVTQLCQPFWFRPSCPSATSTAAPPLLSLQASPQPFLSASAPPLRRWPRSIFPVRPRPCPSCHSVRPCSRHAVTSSSGCCGSPRSAGALSQLDAPTQVSLSWPGPASPVAHRPYLLPDPPAVLQPDPALSGLNAPTPCVIQLSWPRLSRRVPPPGWPLKAQPKSSSLHT